MNYSEALSQQNVINIDLTNPSNLIINVYKFDRIYLNALPDSLIDVIWTPINKLKYLPSSCYTIFTGNNVDYIPERDVEYEVTSGTYSKKIKINLLDKPMNVFDIQLIPVELNNDVLNRNKNQIIIKLKNNPILLNQLIQFYNIQLQSSFSYVNQSKQGRGFRIPWYCNYNVMNGSNDFIMSYMQQYQFMRYLLLHTNQHTHSHFMYLINIIQYNFILKSCLFYSTK